MTERKERCETCLWGEASQKYPELVGCRRFPPTFPALQKSAVWPLTAPEDWCGEWQPKEPQP